MATMIFFPMGWGRFVLCRGALAAGGDNQWPSPQLHHLDICPVVLCYGVRGQRSFWGLSLHALAVSWALYLVSAETLGLVYLIVRIASLEEEDLPVALECEDVCADAVEEPTVV